MLTIVSTSLNPSSKSRLLAQIAKESALARNIDVEFIDLQTIPLPLCDGQAAYQHPNVAIIQKKIKEASTIIIAAPVYNYSVSASCKNFMELAGNELRGKVIGIIAASGSLVSYMAPSSLILSLLLDFRCHIVPKLVLGDASCFDAEGNLTNPEIKERVGKLVEETYHIQKCLAAAVPQ